MGRRKIEIKAIKEERNRSVTFLKRKGGLFKKAHELSVLCSVDIAVIIFGSNKKLYEYSSGDMSDILGRYSYYETPHEHKGPGDYNKGGLDDDDEDIDMGSPPPEAHDHMQPQHMQHPGMQHINSRQGTGSASPPIHARNLGGYPQRNGTPQPGISRPSSRNAPRRISSSNLNPQQGQNGYSYMPGPPVYSHANQHQSMPQGINQGYQYNPNQQPQPQPQAPQQQYDDRRQSMPPVFVQPPRQMPSENPPPIQTNDLQPPSMIEKMPAFKSRSIFTPIVGPDSELGKFMFPAASDNSRDRDRDHSNENNRIQVHRKTTPPPIKSDDHLRESPKQSPPRSAPLPPVPIEPSKPLPPPPTRSNSLPSAPAKRPTLTLTIPIDQQETEAPTGGSSPRDATVAAGAAQQPPTTRPSDAPAGSVVLPPPSPSVTLLSAGATGPVNPFAPRPATTSGPPEQTPLSALPSRFLPGEMLPSPSTFFSDWGATFGGRGGAGDMLPSPLNFQTPIAGQPQHNIFKEEPDTSSKRKSPSLDSPSDASANASTKKVKV